MNWPIVISVAVISIIILIWLITLSIKLSKLQSKYKKYIEGKDCKSIEVKLDDFFNEKDKLYIDIAHLNDEITELKSLNQYNLNKVGLIRYTAFSDVGSDLSFSLAIMDNNNDGFVISSIYGRDDNRIYAKPLKNGQSSFRLSQEEEQAIQKALRK